VIFRRAIASTLVSLSVPLCLLLPVLLQAQTTRKSPQKSVPPSASKLISVKVTGTKRYTPEQVIAATGLQLGQAVAEDDFKKAGQQLGESGAFSEVTYSYQYSGAGTKLDLQLTDSEPFLPARFDNVVWFSDQELADKLTFRVPLFRGQLPVAGDLPDLVSDALQALLIERNVQGRADYLRFAHGDGPIEAFVFTVTGPSIRVRNFEFPGAAPSELPLLQTAARSLQGQDYLRSILRVRADLDFRLVYLERGYLKAAFADAQARLVAETPQDVQVDVTLPVDPGRQYRLTEIQWSGNTVFPADKLQPLIHLQPGQPANAIQLDKDLEAVGKLYRTRGYMTAGAKPVPQMDDVQATVSYQLQIHEGDLYHMGQIEIQGLDDKSTARLVSEWGLPIGDPYDSSYLDRFSEQAVKLLPLGNWSVTTHETPNPEEKTVDVTMRFESKPAP
jgi:outer membrane protein insertion porin family